MEIRNEMQDFMIHGTRFAAQCHHPARSGRDHPGRKHREVESQEARAACLRRWKHQADGAVSEDREDF